MSLRKEVKRSFQRNDQKFIETFGMIILDPRVPGDQSDGMIALSGCETAVKSYRAGNADAIGEWFDSLNDDGKSLLGNVARIVWQQQYRDSKTRFNNMKNKVKEIEEMRNPLGYSYGYGFGVDEDLDYNEMFS